MRQVDFNITFVDKKCKDNFLAKPEQTIQK